MHPVVRIVGPLQQELIKSRYVHASPLGPSSMYVATTSQNPRPNPSAARCPAGYVGACAGREVVVGRAGPSRVSAPTRTRVGNLPCKKGGREQKRLLVVGRRGRSEIRGHSSFPRRW